MPYPPVNDLLTVKMAEHSIWYGGDTSLLTEFYRNNRQNLTQAVSYNNQKHLFWCRQQDSKTIPLHLPVASDISSTSADLLFGDTPEIKIQNSTDSKTQETLDKALAGSSFYAKILEAAEVASSIGGVFIKIAWDKELSDYPIPVIEQADSAYPTFKFGMLYEVTFVRLIKVESTTYYRLCETYTKDGKIALELFRGTDSNFGTKISLKVLEETKDMRELVDSGVKTLLCVYIPNMLPNRLSRTSYLGRSDYSGIEPIFHSIDETYSSWMRDIYLAKGKVIVPRAYLRKQGDSVDFDLDKSVYEKMDIDPTQQTSIMTPVQFEIRSDQYLKTCIELLTRAYTSAGYSPQTFGLSVEGRAESGTALNIRERKSFSTKVKKEQYWEPALIKLIRCYLLICNTQLGLKVDVDAEYTIEFSDGSNNTLAEISSSLAQIAAANAASTEQKVRYLHKDWSEEQIQAEVQKILEETQPTIPDPDSFGKEDNPNEDNEDYEGNEDEDDE